MHISSLHLTSTWRWQHPTISSSRSTEIYIISPHKKVTSAKMSRPLEFLLFYLVSIVQNVSMLLQQKKNINKWGRKNKTWVSFVLYSCCTLWHLLKNKKIRASAVSLWTDLTYHITQLFTSNKCQASRDFQPIKIMLFYEPWKKWCEEFFKNILFRLMQSVQCRISPFLKIIIQKVRLLILVGICTESSYLSDFPLVWQFELSTMSTSFVLRWFKSVSI